MKGFLGSDVLDAVIGTSFIYLLMATFCSTVNEWISGLFNARAATLKSTVRQLLGSQIDSKGVEFLSLFYSHPIVTSTVDNRFHSCYLPSRSFVTALLDLVTPDRRGPISFAQLQESLAVLPEGSLRTSLQALIQNADADLDRVEANIENWFNDAMAHASRSYRRRTRFWTVTVAAILTVSLNADSIGLLRGMPLSGWQGSPVAGAPSFWISRICGWFLTIAAVSLGTPFWFDLLGRVVNPHALRRIAPALQARARV